jgi:hypothetical protein
METYSDLIQEWGPILLSEDLTESGNKVRYWTVAQWKSRNKIPKKYWDDIVRLAPKRKIKITKRKLALMALEQ